nr:reverse transcriptase domain-containing protein [Tanacetum cinerariifolium]
MWKRGLVKGKLDRTPIKNLPTYRAKSPEKISLASDRRNMVNEEVEEWLKSGIVKRGKPKKTKAVMGMPSPSYLKQMQSLSGKLAALNRFLSKATKRIILCLDTLKKCTNKKDFLWTEAAEEAFEAMKRLIAKLSTLTAPMKDVLMVYMSEVDDVVISMLLVKRKGRYMPIYYNAREENICQEKKFKGLENVRSESRDFPYSQKDIDTVGMVRGKGYRKRPHEKIEQWMDNEISFPSIPSSSEAMYEYCIRNLGPYTRAKLRQLKNGNEKPRSRSIYDLLDDKTSNNKRNSNLDDQQRDSPRILKDRREVGSEGNDEPGKAPKENKPPKKVIVNGDHPDQPITIRGSLSVDC